MLGNRYEIIMGSTSADGGGMFLELWDRPAEELALWALYSDVNHSFSFTTFKADVPLKVAEWFQREARRRLPPMVESEPGDTLPPATI